MTMRLKSSDGFTLIEILVVVAIVAILAVVVYPSYTYQIMKTRRSDAKIALAELAGLQENHYVNGSPPTYTASFATLLNLDSGETDKYGFKLQSSDRLLSKDGHYEITFPQGENNNLNRNFTLEAKPVATGHQAEDTDCQWFKIDATGKRTASTDNCW
jgi:type IV pilus assembly protein PilE